MPRDARSGRVDRLRAAPLAPELTPEIVAALGVGKDTAADALFPLLPFEVQVGFRGVPTAVPHAVMRVALDELTGARLDVDVADIDYLIEPAEPPQPDHFMTPEFVQLVLRQVPLRPIADTAETGEVRYRLEIANRTGSPRAVTTADLEQTAGPRLDPPLFNPTTQIGVVHPGRRLTVRGIRITRGWGADHATFSVAALGSVWDEAPRHPASVLLDPTDPAAAGNGYLGEPGLAAPSDHVLNLVVAAAPRGRPEVAAALVADACGEIAARCRMAAATVAEIWGEAEAGGRATVATSAASATFAQVEKSSEPDPKGAESSHFGAARLTLEFRERSLATGTVTELLAALALADPGLAAPLRPDFVGATKGAPDAPAKLILDVTDGSGRAPAGAAVEYFGALAGSAAELFDRLREDVERRLAGE